MSDIHEKLRKLLSLAHQGVGGEKENARTKLEAMMKKHGISLDEIDGDTREMRWFKHVNGEFERRLMLQVISSVCGDRAAWRSRSKRLKIGVEVTKAEQLEINLRYDAYVVALKKELRLCYRAFVQTNEIFHESAEKVEKSNLDPAEVRRMALAMLGMARVAIPRGLLDVSGN